MVKILIQRGSRPYHSRKTVRLKMRENCLSQTLGKQLITKYRLRRCSTATFDAIFTALGMLQTNLLQNGKEKITKIKVPPAEKIQLRDFVDLSPKLLERCIVDNSILDLTLLPKIMENGERHSLSLRFTPRSSPCLNKAVRVLAATEKTFEDLESKIPLPALGDVFEAMENMVISLDFNNICIYMPQEDGENWERRFVSTSWSRDGQSKYDPEKGGALPTSTLKSIIAGNQDHYYVDIQDLDTFTNQGLEYDLNSIRSDLENSEGPSGMLFLPIRLPRSGKLVAVVQIHNRVEKGNSHLIPDSFLPEEGRLSDIFILRKIFERAAKAIETIRLLHKPYISEKSAEQVGMPVSSFNLYAFIREKTITRKYLGYTLGSIINPAKYSDQVINGIIKTLMTWTGRDHEDMREHIINVDELRIAFDGEEPVAFASINALPYVFETTQGRRKDGKVFPLVGTAVKGQHRRMGLQVLLNYELLVRSWLRLKFSRHMFNPLRIATRTRSFIVALALYKHFTDVKFEDLSNEELTARKSFAGHLGCNVDEKGLVKEAYEEAFPEEEIKLRGSKHLTEKVKNALDGLGNRDARIFIMKYSIWNIFKTFLWLKWNRIKKT